MIRHARSTIPKKESANLKQTSADIATINSVGIHAHVIFMKFTSLRTIIFVPRRLQYSKYKRSEKHQKQNLLYLGESIKNTVNDVFQVINEVITLRHHLYHPPGNGGRVGPGERTGICGNCSLISSMASNPAENSKSVGTN